MSTAVCWDVVGVANVGDLVEHVPLSTFFPPLFFPISFSFPRFFFSGLLFRKSNERICKLSGGVSGKTREAKLWTKLERLN